MKNKINENLKKRLLKTKYLKIPEFQKKFVQIKKYLVENNNLGMILIDASKINRIEKNYGKNVYKEVLDILIKIISEMRGKQIRQDDIVTINPLKGDEFYVFLSKKRKEKAFQAGDIENVANRLNKFINTEMFITVYPLLKERPKISIGYAITIYNPLIEEKRQLDQLIEDARTMANYQEFKSLMRNKEKLQELIIKEEIYTVYQPIVELEHNKIIGYEALSRGPKNSEYENPYVLFEIAAEAGILFELDRICRRHAFINAQGIEKDKKLFVNIFPITIQDPEFRGNYLKNFLKDVRISPRSVVLEVSERQAIENYDIFKEASKYYSDIGFAIAVDDAGTGYSNLKALLELKMHYIKIDISLISNISKNILKQEMVRAIVHISNKIKASVIAEGIETKEDLKTLIGLDVHYGQGFLFAHPAPPFPKIETFKKLEK